MPYPKGETYYAFYLRNDNSSTPYTVRRNSYYNIDITRVNHAGEEGEGTIEPENPGPQDPDPGPDPEEPDPENPGPGPDPGPDPDPSPRLEITIRTTEWQGISQGGGL
ncbi:MAG: fimbria major subunit [Tannerellaceae bacterium]|nr:fimbria major subunit [Tannerellaceae bacterium]